MTPPHTESQTPDPAAIWSSARRLHPIYAEMAREFVIDLPVCAALDAGETSPDSESLAQAQQWLNDIDDRIQVHQLRQFLQTTSVVDADRLVALLRHFLAKTVRTDAIRDKIDFLLVQYFSQSAPTDLDDDSADMAYVAQGLEPVLGQFELKAPVWLNALDRVLDSARLIQLEEKGVETIDCRRAQFSAQEPILRLRMICQSWKVMFQAEYSSGQPLRMLVDLRASVGAALGSDATAGASAPASEAPRAAAASAGANSMAHGAHAAPSASVADSSGEVAEFEVGSAAPEWNPDADSSGNTK